MAEWISVKERLPEPGTSVVVLLRHNAGPRYKFAFDGFYGWKWSQYDGRYTVTHWFPLPKPPKDEETPASYISREIAVKKMESFPFQTERDREAAIFLINASVASGSTVREVFRGTWEDVNGDGSLWKCSICGETSCCKGNFCTDCGADMREDGDDG